MPAPIINMASKGKVIRMVEIYFRCFTSRLCTFGYPPTYHAYQNRKYIHCLHWSPPQRTGSEGDFGIIIYLILLQFFQPLAEVRNLPESLNDSSTIFKDTAQKKESTERLAPFCVMGVRLT